MRRLFIRKIFAQHHDILSDMVVAHRKEKEKRVYSLCFQLMKWKVVSKMNAEVSDDWNFVAIRSYY